MGMTTFDKIWEMHTVETLPTGEDILFIDRHLLHEVSSPQAFDGLRQKNRTVKHPELCVGSEDHIVSTSPGRTGGTFPEAEEMLEAMRVNTEEFGIVHNRIGTANNGIIHVIAPEQGVVMPGMTVVCGDSHTCTLGALGTVAFGIGTSEVEHVLATQTVVQKRPQVMRVCFEGTPKQANFVSPKDYILELCRHLGAGGGNGLVIEFAGSAIRNLSMEGRMTICNMAIETGARSGFVSPDDVTLAYVAQTEQYQHIADKVEQLSELRDYWLSLASDDDAQVQRQIEIDVSKLTPQITWGTRPSQSMSIGGIVPVPESDADEKALAFMGLVPGTDIQGLAINTVFIGSCTNSRISDLRVAAEICAGHQVAPDVMAYVVPGSEKVRKQAEEEGLMEIFAQAGFHFREPGCSMCVSINREFVAPGHRCLSTSNRNFEHRQGPNSKTHLCSPAVAAASAITGRVTDPGKLERML